MGQLALFGGPRAIAELGPHFVWPRITQSTENAVLAQLYKTISIYDLSGVFLEFEENFRKLIGRAFALVTNSGTSALFSVFEGLNLSPGDEIIVPAYTFFASVSPLVHFGVSLHQIDSGNDGNIDPELIAKNITRRTRAIVVTHMWGRPCRMDRIMEIANFHGISVVEDCSHAHGARHKNGFVGSTGTAAAWSLQGQKNISGGEGGILLTDDQTLFERALLLGQYNKRAKQQIRTDSDLYKFATTGYGLKLRAHPLAIAIALEQLQHLTVWQGNKDRGALILKEALRDFPFIDIPNTDEGAPSWYAFVFNYSESIAGVPIDVFVKALLAEGLLEIDRPNSTGCIATYPLFASTEKALPRLYNKPALINAAEPQNNARRFYDSAIKLPMWAYADEHRWYDKYADGLRKVCTAVQRTPDQFKTEL